jgi:hypothetical protein
MRFDCVISGSGLELSLDRYLFASFGHSYFHDSRDVLSG